MATEQYALLRKDQGTKYWWLEKSSDPSDVEVAKTRTWGRCYTALSELAKEGWGPEMFTPEGDLLLCRLATREEIQSGR